MIKNILLGFASVALAVASAASSYNVTFYVPVTINGAKLNAGDYKLELKDKTAMIKQGKHVIEAPVTIETDNQKYKSTAVRVNDGMEVTQISIGGTNTRVVFDKTSNATN